MEDKLNVDARLDSQRLRQQPNDFKWPSSEAGVTWTRSMIGGSYLLFSRALRLSHSCTLACVYTMTKHILYFQRWGSLDALPHKRQDVHSRSYQPLQARETQWLSKKYERADSIHHSLWIVKKKN